MNKNIKGVIKVVLKKIMRYDWLGNVNELKNVIKYVVVMCRGFSILIEDLLFNVVGEKILNGKEEFKIVFIENFVKNEIN